jgi:hypothetical protein
VHDKSVVEFGLASRDLSNQGGAVTYEKGEVGNQNVRVLLKLHPDTSLVLGDLGSESRSVPCLSGMRVLHL